MVQDRGLWADRGTRLTMGHGCQGTLLRVGHGCQEDTSDRGHQ